MSKYYLSSSAPRRRRSPYILRRKAQGLPTYVLPTYCPQAATCCYTLLPTDCTHTALILLPQYACTAHVHVLPTYSPHTAAQPEGPRPLHATLRLENISPTSPCISPSLPTSPYISPRKPPPPPRHAPPRAPRSPPSKSVPVRARPPLAGCSPGLGLGLGLGSD